MALRLSGRRIINTDAIVSIRETGEHPNRKLHFTMNNGNEFDVLGDDLEDWIISAPTPYIPAQSGYRVITAHKNKADAEWAYLVAEVIGWSVQSDGDYLFPVTLDGVENLHPGSNTSFGAIIDQRGLCTVPGDAYFDSIDEWKSYIDKINTEHFQRKAQQET